MTDVCCVNQVLGSVKKAQRGDSPSEMTDVCCVCQVLGSVLQAQKGETPAEITDAQSPGCSIL